MHEEEPRSSRAVAQTHPITCIECRRPWLIGSERWRLKVTEDEQRETVPYCTTCWSREFGD